VIGRTSYVGLILPVVINTNEPFTCPGVRSINSIGARRNMVVVDCLNHPFYSWGNDMISVLPSLSYAEFTRSFSMSDLPPTSFLSFFGYRLFFDLSSTKVLQMVQVNGQRPRTPASYVDPVTRTQGLVGRVDSFVAGRYIAFYREANTKDIKMWFLRTCDYYDRYCQQYGTVPPPVNGYCDDLRAPNTCVSAFSEKYERGVPVSFSSPIPGLAIDGFFAHYNQYITLVAPTVVIDVFASPSECNSNTRRCSSLNLAFERFPLSGILFFLCLCSYVCLFYLRCCSCSLCSCIVELFFFWIFVCMCVCV